MCDIQGSHGLVEAREWSGSALVDASDGGVGNPIGFPPGINSLATISTTTALTSMAAFAVLIGTC